MTSSVQAKHEPYLKRCRALGAEAAALGESPVGALLVLDDVVVAEGRESSRQAGDITYHAELVAIRAACRALNQPKLAGSTLYSSHEPCILCSYVIRHMEIARVVAGQPVAHIGGLTSAYPLLTASDVAVWGPPPLVEVLDY